MASTQTSVTDFLNSAATEILVISPGQSISGAQLQIWLNAFNALVRNASTDRLFLFYVPDVQYTLNVSKESYEIGPGAADFDTDTGNYTRPVFAESARVKVGNGRRWPLNMRTEQEWATDPLRSMSDPDGPIDFQYSANIKEGVFRFAPPPVPGQIAYISQWNPLKTFLITELALIMEDYYPDEYITALRGALAIDRAPSYKRQASQELVANTSQAIQSIKALNNTRLGGSAGQSSTLQAPSIGVGKMIQQPTQGQ